MGDTCKVGIIMKKLQGSDRKQNRRLMANRAKRVHAPDLGMKDLHIDSREEKELWWQMCTG